MIKKLIAILLILTIIMPIVPIGEILTYADGEVAITQIEIIKVFDKDQKITERGITIVGRNLKDKEVTLRTDTSPINLGKITNPTIQYLPIKGDSIIRGLIIGNIIIDLDEGTMPNISPNGVSPRTLLSGGNLTLIGNNFDKVTGAMEVRLTSETDDQFITNKFLGSQSQNTTLTNIKGTGMQNIVFEKKIITKVQGNQENIDINIKYNYKNQFMIYKNIDVEGLQMVPNAGKKGTTIRFEAPVNPDESKNLKNQDVFFLLKTDGTDKYTNANKGKNRTELTKETRADGVYNIFTVQVPDGIEIGEYFVVFTNPIPSNQNPADVVVEMMILKDKFTVMQGGREPSISDVDHKKGPNTGKDIKISGQYLGTMNINEFKPDSGNITSYEVRDGNILVVDYGRGTFGTGENMVRVSAKREIRTIIGMPSTYLLKDGKPLVSFTEGMDTIEVRTAPLAETDSSPKKDIVISTTTTFTTDDGKEIIYMGRAELKGGFEYIPSRVQPEIHSITPSKIHVISEGGSSYSVPGGRQLAIYGNNLMIHKYITDNGVEITRYPIIQIGSLIIDKNSNPEYDVKVLDDKGNILDGAENREMGSKILITMPTGKTISKTGLVDVKVINPMRNTINDGFAHSVLNLAEFVTTEDDDNPIIEEVRPNTSPIEGGEKVSIVGANFQPGLKVYIDGEEVKNPKIQADGKKIDIVTPKGREAKTQIQVVNPKGGIATRPFTYIIAYSEPKILSFNPPAGEKNTPVVIKGSGFLKPDPLSSEEIPEKLIGTRVLFGDPKVRASDVNEYNLDGNGEIQFVKFEPNERLFTIDNDRLKLEDYHLGIILEDEQKKKYIIEQYPDGKIILTDRGAIKYTIEYKDKYIKASKEGEGTYTVNNGPNGITLVGKNTIKFIYKTPYKFVGSTITGQNVKVIDANTIYFNVPSRPTRGYYDLTVMNPDTKKDTKEGNKGFQYLTPVGLRPEIYSITPNKGDVVGGYQIKITGKNFSVSEDDKTQVYIDGQMAIITEISIDGTNLTVIVPKYTGNLREKETSQLPVLVVVQNPGGLSAGKEDLFSYIIPGTTPKISRISPSEGSTAGDMVEIYGSEFLFQETTEDLNENGVIDNLIDENLPKEQREQLAEKQTDIKQPYNYYFNSPILPQVYFGNDKIGYKAGKILEFSGDNYLRVLAPPNQSGKIDIYLRNNDGGMSTEKIPYNYIASKLSIDSINPKQSKKQGGIKADIRGTGFQSSNIQVYKEDGTKEEKTMATVRFGNITNKNLPRDHENSGLTRGPIITVKLDGGLDVEYRIESKKLKLQIKEDEKYYTKEFDYNNEVVYIPVNILTSGTEANEGKELIKVYMEDRRLLVERGYAPKASPKTSTLIELETPSYFERKDNISVYVINEDKTEAQYSKFSYTNPEVEPIINNIQRDNMDPLPGDGGKILIQQVNYRGGREIKVTGKNFRKGAKITIEDFISVEAQFISEEELKFIIPELKDLTKLGILHKLRVENPDGGSGVSTEAKPPIYIQFTKGETSPTVSNILPNKGLVTGGTKVIIQGNDFRSKIDGYGGELKVFFGFEQATSVKILDYKTLEVIVPPSLKNGPVQIKIENPDGTLTADNLIFTYISKPEISDISPKKLFTNDISTVVTIKGQQFLTGAKVIIGGKLQDAKSSDIIRYIIGVDNNGNNIEKIIIGGKEAATVQVVSDTEIKVTFREATDLENTSIIVINPDGGISEPYNSFKYELPLPLKPMVLEAIPGYEKTVMLIWNKSDPNILNSASSYEIYGRKTKDTGNTFVATTDGAEYLVKGLEPNVEYTFLVRALNKYGAAIDFAEVTVKTLTTQEDHKQKEKEDKLKEDQKNLNLKGKETIIGNKVTKTLGTDDIKNGLGLIDFTLSKYKNATEYIIQIPLALARTDSTLNIKDGTMTMVINPKDLYTYKVSAMDEGDKDSNLQIIIKKGRETNIERGKKVASSVYDLDFKFQRGKDIITIDKLLRSGKLTLDLDSLLYTNTKNLQLTVFNIATGKYEKAGESRTTSFNQKGKYLLLSDK